MRATAPAWSTPTPSPPGRARSPEPPSWSIRYTSGRIGVAAFSEVETVGRTADCPADSSFAPQGGSHHNGLVVIRRLDRRGGPHLARLPARARTVAVALGAKADEIASKSFRAGRQRGRSSPLVVRRDSAQRVKQSSKPCQRAMLGSGTRSAFTPSPLPFRPNVGFRPSPADETRL